MFLGVVQRQKKERNSETTAVVDSSGNRIKSNKANVLTDKLDEPNKHKVQFNWNQTKCAMASNNNSIYFHHTNKRSFCFSIQTKGIEKGAWRKVLDEKCAKFYRFFRPLNNCLQIGDNVSGNWWSIDPTPMFSLLAKNKTNLLLFSKYLFLNYKEMDDITTEILDPVFFSFDFRQFHWIDGK